MAGKQTRPFGLPLSGRHAAARGLPWQPAKAAPRTATCQPLNDNAGYANSVNRP